MPNALARTEGKMTGHCARNCDVPHPWQTLSSFRARCQVSLAQRDRRPCGRALEPAEIAPSVPWLLYVSSWATRECAPEFWKVNVTVSIR